MPDYLEEVIDLISQGIVSGKTMEATRHQLQRMMKVPDDILDSAQFAYEERTGVIRALKDPAALMTNETKAERWYMGPKTTDVFWPGVSERLAQSLSELAVDDIGKASSKILSVMKAPGSIEISTRGLVLGYVQSGKTTSFISLIAKAADAGYRVFIVLSGVTDNLRGQTQRRIDQLLIADNDKAWYKLTNRESDFALTAENAAALLSVRDFRFIAVVKKNPARLRRLRDWLAAAGPAVLAGVPIVIIDDEADQASIDVSKLARTSTINGLLREILNQPKSAYVAYTATPFANLLIDPQGKHGPTKTMSKDLYPEDFIVPLPEPGGYFGAEKMFGRSERLDEFDEIDDGMDVIRVISPEEAIKSRPPKTKGSVYSWQPSITPGLGEAISWFLLSTSARRARGKGNPHSTMLIHTSMLAEAHVRIAQIVYLELDRIRDQLVAGDELELRRLEALYVREVKTVDAQEFGNWVVPVEEVLRGLLEVVIESRVVIDNYLSPDRLSYDDDNPSTAIVVGGNTLSRGLTLEGLSSSYFVRSASAYDTLLQMGRWFGYREHYEDLCRVWMTDELRLWFRDLSLVEAEIRSEMTRYDLENLSPREVAVRIRTHPGMAITAAAKMRGAVDAEMSFSSMRPQTILFSHENRKWLEQNIDAVSHFLTRATESGSAETKFRNDRRGLTNVTSTEVLDLISRYKFHPDSKNLRGDLLSKYIRNENAAGSIQTWNVVLMEGDSGSRNSFDLGPLGNVIPLERSRLSKSNPGVANMKALVSTKDRVADLDVSNAEITRLLSSKDQTLTDASLTALRSRLLPGVGLLCVYPIDKDSVPQRANEKNSRVPLGAEANLVGLAFFFPPARGSHSHVGYKSADLSSFMNEDIDEEIEQMDAADEADAAIADGLEK